MKTLRSMSATVAVAMLALTGCDNSTKQDTVNDGKNVGGIAAKLSLPDDSEIDDVSFNITGPAGYSRTGTIPTSNSTTLTFRIGEIPVQSGYNIQLDATTSFGNTCTGDADFDILDNQTTLVSIVITCGATDDVGDIIVNGAFQSCPVITSITAIPGEITLGNAISLSSTISHGTNPVEWTGAGGTFGTPNAYDTSFTCDVAGTHTLTVAVDTADCSDSRTVDVTCTLGAGCGNGQLDAGEQCDDGNTLDTDSCTSQCRTAACGDGFVNAGVEECDDSNSITEECAYGLASCEVCDSACELNAGEVDVCGDGTVDASETCDDSNATTEACAYGLTSCTVCNAICQSAAGATSFCGDNIVNGAEACDGGPACSATCEPLVDNCTPCRQANCTTYQGIDWVAGCFDSTATGDTARAAGGATFSPAQVQTCVDAMACASANDCGRTLGAIGNDCYCGAFGAGFGLDECIATGPNNGAGDAPCSDEWRAATEQTTPANVLGGISDISTPAGWAYFLLECEATFCAAVCP